MLEPELIRLVTVLVTVFEIVRTIQPAKMPRAISQFSEKAFGDE